MQSGLKKCTYLFLFHLCAKILLLTWGRGQFVRINLCAAVPFSLFLSSLDRQGHLLPSFFLLSKPSRLLHRGQIKSCTKSGAPCHLKRCGNRSIRTVFCCPWPSEGLPRFRTQNGAEKNAGGTCDCSLTGKVTRHPLAPQSEQTCQRRLILRNRLTAGGAHPGAGRPHPWSGGAGSPAPGAPRRRSGGPQTPPPRGKVSHLRQRVWLGPGALRPLDAQLSRRS